MEANDIINFVESIAPKIGPDYEGLIVNGKNKIESISVIVFPELDIIKKMNSDMIISHHKILSDALSEEKVGILKKRKIAFYSFHLPLDVMEGGIADSFLESFCMGSERITMVYKGAEIKGLGRILKDGFSHTNIIKLLKTKLKYIRVLNEKESYSRIAFIPGSGFKEDIIMQLKEKNVDTIISSEPTWHSEMFAKDLGITLIEISHYESEKIGMVRFAEILKEKFPNLNISFVQEENIAKIY